jgi:serine O-acetyltransferase
MIHTSTCITSTSKLIGDGLMVGTGGKITSCQALGNSVSVGANSVVTESFCEDNILLAGMPAIVKRTGYKAWYDDNEPFATHHAKCEELRKQWGIGDDCLHG